MIAPSFHQIPFRLSIGAITGFLSAKIAGSSTNLWVKIAVTTSLADSILYLGVIRVIDQKFSRKMTHMFIHALVSTIEIVALRGLGLIAKKGMLWMSAYAVSRCIIQAMFKESYFVEPVPRLSLDTQSSTKRRERSSPANSPR